MTPPITTTITDNSISNNDTTTSSSELIRNNFSENSTALVSKHIKQTTTNATNNQTRTRFIGKHSRDNRLSIFLNRRNSNSASELLGLVRINRDALHSITEKSATVVVGVMARLLCDHGLQFTEHFIYQKETCIYPPQAGVSCEEIELVQGVLGDAVLPDEFHRGFRIKLPTALPPSCIFLSPDTSMGPGLTGDSPWGLTYYLYAYLNSQPHHRKSSKVFLSFTRAMPSDTNALIRETTPPAVSVSKASNRLLMTSGAAKSLNLHAALDRSFFYTDEQMAVHLKLENPRAVNFSGIRVTLKQIITMRALNHGRQVIKVPLAAYEFKSIDANGKLQHRNQQNHQATTPCLLKDFPFIIDTLRIQLRPGPELQHVAVESRLPRNQIRSLILCPSFAQTYEMQDNPLKYFAIEYYMNVHVILPWGTNLIAKLPFTIASRGVEESEGSSSDNLTTFEVRESSEDLRDVRDQDDQQHLLDDTLERKKESIPNPTHQISSIDYRIVKCDMERALKLLEAGRSKLEMANNAISTHSEVSFTQMRRTWVREFAEVAEEVSSGFSKLESLIHAKQQQPYSAGSPVSLIQTILDRLVPLYLRFLPCHEKAEHVQVLEDALNQVLDTLELVLMKFHLLATKQATPSVTDDVEVNLHDLEDVLTGRLRKEMDKLILSIPGIMEWRWFLEELYFTRTDCGDSDVVNDCEADNKMAALFQSIHSRLTEAFSDAQIHSHEILSYAQLFLARINHNNPEAYKAHYSYFRKALLVYYGNYPALLIPFDPQTQKQSSDLKALRDSLNTLRNDLIQAMI